MNLQPWRKLVRPALVVTAETLSVLIFALPRYRALNGLKSWYLRTFYRAKIGRRVVYYPGIFIFTGRQLEVGDDVDFARGVTVTTDGGLFIGDRVLIGYGTHILTRNHRIPALPGRIFDSGHISKSVSIGSDVWIGASCVLLPGVRIGANAVIAAGSVVTSDVPENTIVAGVPARVIRHRD